MLGKTHFQNYISCNGHTWRVLWSSEMCDIFNAQINILNCLLHFCFKSRVLLPHSLFFAFYIFWLQFSSFSKARNFWTCTSPSIVRKGKWESTKHCKFALARKVVHMTWHCCSQQVASSVALMDVQQASNAAPNLLCVLSDQWQGNKSITVLNLNSAKSPVSFSQSNLCSTVLY